MKYTVDRTDNTATLRLHEPRLDASNSGELKGAMLILCSSGIDVLFIDMTEVEACDSTGMSALLLVHREMKNHNGYAILHNLTERAESMIQLAQLDRVLYIYPTKEEALADLRGEDDPDDDLDMF